MVDFQERDTRRGLQENGEGADDRSRDGRSPDGTAARGTSDGERDARNAGDAVASGDGEGADDRPSDGEVDIDEVRQQLEERPEPPARDPHAREDEDDHHAGDDEGDDHGDEGHHHDHDLETLGAAVVTISSSRTLADDPSGDHVVEVLVEAGHDVVTRELIPDDYDDVQHTVDALVRRGDVDVVVTTGGTGVTPDDKTIEAVRPLFSKELPGFGELFRRYSYGEIGTRVVATRATAGVVDGVPVFCLPGSRDAVALGVEEIIVEEAPHLAGLAARELDHEE